MVKNNAREKKIEGDIKKYLLSFYPYIHFDKNHGSMYTDPGRPDIVACVMGRYVAIETKRGDGGIQSESQKAYEKFINDAGGVYILADSVDDVKSVIY